MGCRHMPNIPVPDVPVGWIHNSASLDRATLLPQSFVLTIPFPRFLLGGIITVVDALTIGSYVRQSFRIINVHQ